MSLFWREEQLSKANEIAGEKLSRIDNIDRALRGGEYEEDHLSNTVRFHALYGGGRDSVMAKLNQVSPSGVEDAYRLGIDPLEMADYRLDDRSVMQNIADVTAYSAFSSFDSDMQDVLADGTAALRRLHSRFYFGDTQKDLQFASKNVFRYLYNQNDVDIDSLNQNEIITDLRDHVLDTIVNNDINSGRRNVLRVESELNRIVNGNLNRARNVQKRLSKRDRASVAGYIDKHTYMNRPGIYPFLSLIEGAQSEIVIDTFQFQNKAISDYLMGWVRRRAMSGKTPSLTIRLAMPVSRNVDNRTSYEILGPNLIQLKKFEEIKKQLSKELGYDVNINVEYETDRHHGKLYWTDKAAIIGSINLTSPVGHNPIQAGGNFETMRIFHSRLGHLRPEELRLAASKDKGSAFRERLRKWGAGANRTNQLSSDDVKEEMLYRQVTRLKNQMQVETASRHFLDKGRGQIGLGGDVFEHLERTLELLDENSSGISAGILEGTEYRGRGGRVELHMILDQVMALQYARGLFDKTMEGEFGDFSDDELNTIGTANSRKARYRRLQKKLFRNIIEGRAIIFADTRNLREGVLDRLMFDKYDPQTNKTSKSLISSELLERFDYDLSKIAALAEGETAVQKVRSLTKQFSHYGMKADVATQVLALASGNIRAVAVPRQHVKGYALMARLDIQQGQKYHDIVGIAGGMVTSNMGPWSLGMRDADGNPFQDNQHVSHELGLTLMLHQARGMKLGVTSEYALEANQEYVELQSGFMANWQTMVRLLGDSHIDNPNFSHMESRSSWEGNVDRKGLYELKSKLEAMIDATGLDRTGFSINTIYDATNSRAVALEIGLDARALAGFGQGFDSSNLSGSRMSFRFTTLRGGRGVDPMVYAIDQSLMIGRSIFVNNYDGSLNVMGNTVASKSHIELSSMDNTLAFLATLSGEMMHRYLLSGPINAFNSLGVERQREAIGRFLARSAGIVGGELEHLYNPSILTPEHAFKLAEYISNKLSYGNESQKRAAAIAGINFSEDAAKKDIDTLVAKIRHLNEFLSRMGTNRRQDPQITQQLVGATGGVIDRLMSMIKQGQRYDLLIDIMSHSHSLDYYTGMSRELEKVKTMLLEPYLTYAQHNIYGSSQGHYRMTIRGVSNNPQYADAIEMARNYRLGAYALPSLALTYGPTTNLRKTGLIRSIADKSTVSFGVGEGLHFLNTPLQDMGDVTSMNIIESLGVGYVTNKSTLEAEMRALGLFTDTPNTHIEGLLNNAFGEGADPNDMYAMFNFAGRSKAAQIPQRLKNAIGARPMYDISERAQEYLEWRGDKKQSVSGMSKAYVEDLRKSLRNYITTNRDGASSVYAAASEQEVENIVNSLVTSDMDIGFMFAGEIRKVLSAEQALQVELEREEIESMIGVGATSTPIGAEILRVRMLRADMYGYAYRGFIGGSRRKGRSGVGFIQLGGMYSDYFYANPTFGGTNGMRQGWMERAEKRVKASMLSTEWQEKVQLAVREGYTIRLDKQLQRAAIFDEHGNYIQVIDDRNQFDELLGVVENMNVSSNPSIAKVQVSSSNRLGEDSVELIMRVTNIRPASVGKNQMMFELQYIRSKMPGGGSRVEGNWSGALLKGVSIFANVQHFSDINDQLNRLGGGSFTGTNIDVHQVFGLFNPSNLKSYVHYHGAEILTDINKRSAALQIYNDPSMGSKRLAAALILGFGTDFIEGGNKTALRDSVYRLAAQGQLGAYMQTVALASALTNLSSNPGDPAYNVKDDYRTVFVKSAGFNIMQTPSLAGITASDITDALNGQGAELLRKVNEAIHAAAEAETKGYMIIGDTKQRQASIMLATLDIVSQLSAQTSEMVNVPTDINPKDPIVRQQLAAILGFDKNYLENNEATVEGMIAGLSTRMPVIRMWMDVSYSYSKEPIGTKLTGRMEMQHLIKPFLYQANELGKDKSLAKMRLTVANMLAAVSQGSLYQFMGTPDSPLMHNVIDITDPFINTPMFKKRMLGVHGSAIDSDAFEVERRAYNRISDEIWTEITRSKNGAPNNRKLKKLYAELRKVEAKLTEIGRYYQMFDDKPAGVGLSNAIVGAMNHKSFGFFVPEFNIASVEEDRVILSIDQGKGFYSYLPSGEELKLIGAQFGNYVDEIIQASITVQSAFAPGSPLEDFFLRLSKNRNSTYMTVTADEIQHLQRFQMVSRGMIELLAAASAGTRLQMATGAGLPFRGAVSTPAASFLVPPNMVILAREALDRNGFIAPSTARWRMLEGATNQYEQAVSELSKAIEDNDRIGIALSRIKKDFTSASKYALTDGMSEQGTRGVLSVAIEESARIRKNYEAIMKGADNSKKIKDLRALRKRVGYRMDKLRHRIDARNKGDAFAEIAALSEMEYWLSKTSVSLHETKYGSGNEPAPVRKSFSYHQRKVQMFEELPFHIAGFSIGAGDGTRAAVHYAAFEGALRRNSTFTPFHDSIIDEISSSRMAGKKEEFLDYKLESLINQVKGMSRAAETRQSNVRDSVKAVMKYSPLNDNNTRDRLVADLERIRTHLKSGKANVTDVIAEINSAFAKYDVTGLGEGISFRSPPFGGTEPGLHIMQVISQFEFVNELSKEINAGAFGSKGITYESSGRGNRNQTASLFSPISIMTSNLGDFDGDPYTFIFREVQDLVFQIERKKDRLKILELERSALHSKLMDSTLPTSEVHRIMYQEEESISTKISSLQSEIPQLELKIVEMNSHLERDFQGKEMAAKEVAVYMGIDVKYMTSKANGGLLDSALEANMLFTFLEQGRGLFSGVERKATHLTTLWSALDKLIDPDFNSSTDRLNKHLKSVSDLQARAAELANTPDDPLHHLYARIGTDADLAGAIHKELTSFIEEEQIKKVQDSTEFGAHLGHRVGAINNALIGMSEFHTYMQKASGVAVEYSAYDMLTKVLGKAGGDILGKTYNSLVGTLFADSPLLALGHVITRDDHVVKAVSSYIDQAVANGLDLGGVGSGAEFIEHLKGANAKAEQLQGFMKSVQQMLRDSIKFKGGTDIINDLKRQASIYDSADASDADRAAALDNIVKNLGPGPGLKAVMKMDAFINQISGDGISEDNLIGTYGVGLDEANQIGSLLEGHNLIRNVDSHYRNKMIAAYKTTRDMQHMITAYRFNHRDPMRDGMFMSTFMSAFEAEAQKGRFGAAAQIYFGQGNREQALRSAKDNVLDKFTDSSHKDYAEYRSALESYISSEIQLDDIGISNVRAGANILDEKIRIFKKEKGEEGLLLFSHIYEQTKSDTQGLFGQFGENLLRFATFDNVREAMASIMAGSSKNPAVAHLTGNQSIIGVSTQNLDDKQIDDLQRLALGRDVMGSDITMTIMNLAASNKLDPSAAATFYQSLEGVLKIGGGLSNPEDVLSAVLTSSNRFNNGSEQATVVSNTLAAIANMEKHKEGNEFVVEFNDRNGQPTRAIYSSLMDFLTQSMQETRTAMESQAISSFIKTFAQNSSSEKNRVIRNSRDFARSMLIKDGDGNVDEQEVSRLANLLEEHVDTLGDFSETGISTRVKPTLEDGFAGQARQALKALSDDRSASAADMILPAFLTILGSAMSSGAIDENAIHSAVGGTITSLAYARPSFMKSGVGSGSLMLGGSFKVRTALQNSDEEPGIALAQMVAREVATQSIMMTVSEPLTRFMTEKVFRTRPTTLDKDYFEGSKNAAGLISGAILSAALGMIGGNAVKMMMQLPGKDWVDITLDNIAERARKIDQERLIAESNASIINDETGEEIDVIYSPEPVSFYGMDPEAMYESTYTDSDEDMSVPVNLFEA